MREFDDTIAAIATPAGEGAVGIVRLSGKSAIALLAPLFHGSLSLLDAPGNTVHFGRLSGGNGRMIDEVLVTVFRAPKSYTGEDLAEVGCHGGTMVVREVLRALLESGARQAGPGEFTRRAFLNGKMDLTRAEAVADLIASRSERARAVSSAQLEGKLAGKVAGLKSRILSVCALLELDLDFSEEDLPIVARSDLKDGLQEIGAELRMMRESYERGRIVRDGLAVAIVGKPNAGKSSLFNALLREHRAIVTPHAGTTRDTLEECISLDGILFTLTDTAGLRETTDAAEAEGVSRSRRTIGAAGVIVYVIDGSNPGGISRELDALEAIGGSARKIAAVNKSDLMSSHPEGRDRETCISVIVSARTGDGLDRLEAAMIASAGLGQASNSGNVWITRQRHADAIEKGLAALESGLASLTGGATNEFIAFDLRECSNALSEITGEVTSEDVLHSIFSRFCVGK